MLYVFSGAVYGSTIMYIQSVKAKLLSEPSFQSKLIKKLEHGNQVNVVQQTGRWTKVKHEESEGWISSLLLSKTPPIKKNSLLLKKDPAMQNKARRRASSSAVAAATRGLRGENRARVSDENHADYQALEKVESIKVKDSDAWDFHKQIMKKETP